MTSLLLLAAGDVTAFASGALRHCYCWQCMTSLLLPAADYSTSLLLIAADDVTAVVAADDVTAVVSSV